jgi:hypothetical protein
MANRTATTVTAGMTIAAAWLYLSFHPRPPGIDCRPHEALGEVLAGEAMGLMEPGARLIVIARATEPFHVPAAAAQLEGFLKAVRKSGQNVSAIRSLNQDPLRVAGVPPGEFFDLLRQARDNDVIVSFLGPPVLGDDQLAKLGGKRPRILAVCSGAMPAQVDLRRTFQQRLLLVAVVSRPDAPAQAAAGSAQSAFDRMFKVITAANASELPPAAVARN